MKNLDRDAQIKFACKMFQLKGFSPSVIGNNLYLECWNDELTEAYHVGISDEEIEFQANEYLQGNDY
jgi:hypothetical protein